MSNDLAVVIACGLAFSGLTFLAGWSLRGWADLPMEEDDRRGVEDEEGEILW